MIKGKKIGDLNVKVTMRAKDSEKAVGVPLGKFYVAEKRQPVHEKEQVQCENEEDQQIVGQQEEKDHKISAKTLKATDAKPDQTKQNQKINSITHKQSGKGKAANKTSNNRSLDKYTQKTENKAVPNSQKIQMKAQKPVKSNNSQKKQGKMGVKESQATPKAGNATVSSVQQTKVVIQIQGETQATQTRLEQPSKEVAQLVQEEEVDETEEERNYLPQPYIEQIQPGQIFTCDQISFQDYAFDSKAATEPVFYASSQEQDSSEEEDSQGQALQPRQLAIEKKDEPRSQYGSLDLNDELFSLSAEELLAKQYFNV